MARLRFRGRRRSTNSSLLLLALGAVTGVALGVILAERSGGTAGMKARLARVRRRLHDEDLPDPAEEVPSLVDTQFHHAWRPPAEAADESDHDFVADVDATDGPPDDSELEARVLEAFRNDPTLRGRAIDIGAIGDGVIELTGWVHSPAEVGHALTLARGVPDVSHVMDRLTIRGTDFTRAGPTASDR